MIRTPFLFAAMLVAASARAQAPHEDWRTITTRHFRIHYTKADEAWTLPVAARIESIRDAVVAEVGFAPERITDVVVENPLADPNGITYSLLGSPRIVLFTEPPGPELQIGEFGDWPALLTTHEMTHLVHLLRPSRNRWQQRLEKILPLDPIALGAPRWVLEGYATLIEGRITGSGRPSGSMRAAILRTFAREGRLPSYAQLSSDRRFLGMSMAYLAGSAFLEWLEKTHGQQTTRDLWARMTARERRGFAEAFTGVFGDSPSRLYGRFAADLTASAVAVSRSQNVREGELWQETTRGSGDPAVSPDGRQIALVLRDQQRRATLVIESTGPNEEEPRLSARIAEMLRRDPQDVAPVRTKPLPRKHLFTFVPIDGGDLEAPRWTRDGRSLLYSHRQPDLDGTLHHDLFVWTPSTGRNRRVTHLADVHDADPLPDGRTAIAVRTRHGLSQLVVVDLDTGAIVEKTAPRTEVVVSHPRASASGALAWSEHRGDRWFVNGAAATVRDSFNPEWGPHGELYATVAGGGFFNVARLTERGAEVVVRSANAAFQPAPAPDGSLYFMSLEPDGFVVRKIAPDEGSDRLADDGPRVPVDPRPDPSLVPALPPAHGVPVTLRDEAVTSRPYGIGRQERALLFGGQASSSGTSVEAGLRIGDVAGRLDTLILGATGGGSLPRGAAIASVWKRWPLDLGAHLFHAGEQSGLEVSAQRSAQFPGGLVSARAGSLRLRHEQRSFAAGAASAARWRRFEESGSLALDSAHHARATLGGAVRLGSLWLAAGWMSARNLSIGGAGSSIEPDSLLIERRLDPALDRDAMIARRPRGERVELRMGVASLFWQRYTGSGTIDVTGAELALVRAATPLLEAAGMQLTAGLARVRPDHRTRAWLALRWRP